MSYSIGDGIVTLALAGGIVGYVHITHQTRRQRLEVIHQERLIAMEKGIPLPELPLEPEKRPYKPDPTILPIMGLVLSTLSIGAMVGLALMLPAASQNFWIAPLPLAFLGIGLFAFHLLSCSPRR